MIIFKVGIPHNIYDAFYDDWEAIINFGFNYSHLGKKNLYFTIYFNYDRLNYPTNEWNIKQNLYKIGLGLQYSLHISESGKLLPQIGMGYVYQNLNFERYNWNVDNSGINIQTELGLIFELIKRLNFGFSIRYDYVKLAGTDKSGSTVYNRDIHTITPTLQTLIEL